VRPRKCWAECLGDCSGVISKEHLVSEGLFSGRAVSVRGFHWCKGSTRELPIRKLTANILCVGHNNGSSNLDKAAQEAFQTLKDIRELRSVREALKAKIWTVVDYTIDGLALERWFLKTLINVAYTNWEHELFAVNEGDGAVPEELVEIVFGRRRFDRTAGLYYVGGIGDPVDDSIDRVAIEGILRVEAASGPSSASVIGGAFLFLGHRFLLWLDANGPPSSLRGVGVGDDNWSRAGSLHHLKALKLKQGKYLSQRVRFRW
jgi:hypothetical protein